jgi:hypothetical protein
MRRIAVVILLAFLAGPAGAQDHTRPVEFHVTSSKILGLFEFTLSAAGNQEGPGVFRRLIEGSKFATLETESLRRLADLDLGAHNYIYSGYPETHGQTIGAGAFFRMAAAKASDLNDFRDRTAGIVPIEDQNTLVQAMLDAEPAYDSLLWTPYGAAIERHVENLTAHVDVHGLDDRMRRLAAFYGSSWPAELPFRVALHPYPPQRGFSAGVFGNVAMSGIVPGFSDYAMYASIVLHEIAHQLYGHQPRSRAHALRTTMLASPSPTAMLAYRWLDEALATAVANGWAYEQMSGSVDEGAWYDNRIIDGYARALYPRVIEYLEHGREIDDEFLHHAVVQFEATFPEALGEPEALFPFFSLVTDLEGDLNEWLAPLFERYRLRGTSISTHLNDANLAGALNSPDLAIVLLTRTDPEKQALLYRHLPPEALEADRESVFTVNEEGYPVLFLQVDSPEGFRRVMDRVAAEGLMSSKP